jgi:hypothetical protein
MINDVNKLISGPTCQVQSAGAYMATIEIDKLANAIDMKVIADGSQRREEEHSHVESQGYYRS